MQEIIKEFLYLLATSLITILIIIGNAFTISVIVRKPKLGTPSNQLILGLAAADLMVGVTLLTFKVKSALDVFVLKNTHEPTKTFEHAIGLILFYSCCTSIFHLIFISIDRYLCLRYPLKHKVYFTKRRSKRLVLGLWLLAPAFAIIPFAGEWLADEDTSSETRSTNLPFAIRYYAYFLVTIYAILLVVISFMYIRVYQIASKSSGINTKAITAVSFVLGCFCLCWTPVFGCILLACIDPSRFKIYLEYSFHALMIAPINSCVNPLIYAWKIRSFRDAFEEILCCCRKSSKPLLKLNSRSASQNEGKLNENYVGSVPE